MPKTILLISDAWTEYYFTQLDILKGDETHECRLDYLLEYIEEELTADWHAYAGF